MYVYNIRLAHKSESVDWKHAVDGSLSANDWGPFLSYGELPTDVDPANGYLQNANNSPWNTAQTWCRPTTLPTCIPATSMGGGRDAPSSGWSRSRNSRCKT